MKKLVPLCIGSAIIPFLGFAHEGHGHTNGFTITHYFVEPEHVIVILFVLAVGRLCFSSMRKKAIKED